MLFSWSVPLVMKFYQQFQLLSFFLNYSNHLNQMLYFILIQGLCCKSVKLQTKNLKMFSAFLYFSSVFNTNLRALYILNLERWYCCWEGSSLSENHNIFSYHALIDQFVVKIKFISIEYKTPLRYQNVFFFMHFKCSI